MTGMDSWGVALGGKVLKCNEKYGCRGGRLGVPMDLYGHNPSEVQQYKTWTGFGFSLAVFLVVFISCAYVVYEYYTLPYDLAQSAVLHDGEVNLQPESFPRIPDFGVQVSSSNGTVLDVSLYPGLVDIFFWQNFVLGDGSGGICPGKYEGERCRKRVRIPSEKCRFLGEHEDEQKILAFCPMWGVLEESLDDFGVLDIDFDPTETRENATVPSLQGNFLDPVYSFIEADVYVNLTGMSIDGPAYELDLKDIYGGAIAYICAFTRDDLFDVGIKDSILNKYKRWSQSFKVKEYLTSTIDIPLTVRNVSKGNYIVDFDFLETEVADVIVGTVNQDLDDAAFIPTVYALQNATNNIPLKFDAELQQYVNVTPPETLLLSRAFIHVDQTGVQIIMTPPSTIFDILGVVGGFLSLFSLVIGWPAMIVNQFQYTRALKRATREGIIPEEYLEESGAVKVDKANEVVNQLTKRGRPQAVREQSSHPDQTSSRPNNVIRIE